MSGRGPLSEEAAGEYGGSGEGVRLGDWRDKVSKGGERGGLALSREIGSHWVDGRLVVGESLGYRGERLTDGC